MYQEELYEISEKTTIVITQSWESLSDEEKVQLSKITDALKQRVHPTLGLDAFRVVAVEALDLSSWKVKPSRLVYFGPGIKGLNNYELIQAEGTRMVLSESLADLIPNDGARTRLWQALKQLFSA